MKIQRKYMAHYLNAHFASDSTGKDDYIRLGKDLEEYSPEAVQFQASGMSSPTASRPPSTTSSVL